VVRQFDRSEPVIEHAGSVFIASTALLLLVSATHAWAEDEPAARAPLPPPRSAAAEAGERQIPDPAPNANQPTPRPPATGLDRPRSQLSERKLRLHSASDRGTGVAKKRATLRLANRSVRTGSRRQNHRAVISERSPGRDRSPTEAGIGHLFPPSDYPDPRLRSTTQALPEPPQAPPYYPNYFPGPPAYGYAPSYPYSWAPPGPGVFR
jgi:hypothetical protein